MYCGREGATKADWYKNEPFEVWHRSNQIYNMYVTSISGRITSASHSLKPLPANKYNTYMYEIETNNRTSIQCNTSRL